MILINGMAEDKIAVTDRGLAYGDGVFRTLAVSGGRPLCWQRHFIKLRDDCLRLRIPQPPEKQLLEEVERVARYLGNGVAKIIVTRGQGERGYALPAHAQPVRIVIGSAMPSYPTVNARDGIRARLCELRLSDQPYLAGIKHLNRLENVLARAEWSDPAIAEGLLLDQRGNLVEGVTSNLFLMIGGTLVTPELSRAGVAGVTRERILAWALETGLPCEIREVPLDELWTADEVMVCNSLIGVWQIRGIEGKNWEPGTCTPRIRNYLTESHD